MNLVSISRTIIICRNLQVLISVFKWNFAQRVILEGSGHSTRCQNRVFLKKKSFFNQNLWFFENFFLLKIIHVTFYCENKKLLYFISYPLKDSISQGIQPIHRIIQYSLSSKRLFKSTYWYLWFSTDSSRIPTLEFD